jgi:Icc-related predicted phosphoesterase
MRLWIFSDLHLDVNAAFAPALPTRWPAHDAVVIAGDVQEGLVASIEWIARSGLHAKPVIYVGGNHEFYGRDRYGELQEGRAVAARHNNIHLLERDRLDVGGVTFLGATLWTDYKLFDTPNTCMALAERLMSDHRMIAHDEAAFSATSALHEHRVGVAWLAEELAKVRSMGRKTVVVSHHAPSAQSISEAFRSHPLSAAFASRLEHLMPGVALWVHGHMHRHLDYRLEGARVVNNPLGYLRREQTGFQPSFVVTI